MALIKNAIARHLARDAVVLDLGDLQRQGSLIIRQAQQQAEAVLADARQERERLLAHEAEKGHAEGYAKGLEEGRIKGRDESFAAAMTEHKSRFEQVEASWGTALSEFSAQRDVLVQRATDDVLNLAILIAESVVKRAIAVDPNIVVDQLRAVLGVIVRPTELVVAIHPDDRPIVQAALPGLLSLFGAIRHAELIDDPSLSRGSCIARMRGEFDGNTLPNPTSASTGASAGLGGEIDASISTQLDRIIQAIVPARAAEVTEGDHSF